LGTRANERRRGRDDVRTGVARGGELFVAGICLSVALLAQRAAALPAEDASATGELKKLSLEELVNVEVTSVSRHPQKLARSASAVQVITAEEIRRSGATSIPEALRLADNLDVAQKNAHDWAITARGFNTALANKMLVLIDGRTVYTPLFSGVFWDVQNTLLADIDRIEVISGPGGTQWGANAVNGVINIITKTAKDTQGAYAEAGAGSSLEDAQAVRYGAELAPGVFARAYAERFDRGDEVLPDGARAADAWNQRQGGFRVDAELSKRSALTVQGDIYAGDERVPGSGGAEVGGGNLLGRWSCTSADGADMSLQLYFDRTHLKDPIDAEIIGGHVLAPAGAVTDDLDTYDLDFQYRASPGDRQRVEWGFGVRHTRDDVRNAPAVAFYPSVLDQNLVSAFVQDEITLGGGFLATVGTKLEHNDYTGLEAEPSVRLQWNATEDEMLWAAVSRAVRTPSRIDHDLSQPERGYPLIVLEGSPDFVSETVLAYELGYRAQFGPDLATSIAAFYNDYDHIRSTSITPTTILPLFFANNVEGETHGLELGVDYEISDAWRLHGSYDPLIEHLHVKPGQFDFNAALNETADPHERFTLRSSLDLPHRLEFDAALRYTSARDLNNGPHVVAVPGYWECDVRLGWHVTDKLEVSLVGQNLLHDHHLEYGYPGPTEVAIERSVFGKLAWRF